jgi:hypothetical protein
MIAHLYDYPGRDCDTDPNLVEFLEEKQNDQVGHIINSLE